MISGAASDVLKERLRQDEKWGEQNHLPETWLAILMEEMGETAQAVLHARDGAIRWEHYRNELVQTAAVALAALECFDRNYQPEPLAS